MVWNTPRGVLVADSDATSRRFYLLSPTDEIVAVFAPGAFSLEDDLYEWQVRVEGTQLLKVEVVQNRHGQHERVAVELDGLSPLGGSEARRYQELLRVLVAEREAQSTAQAVARRDAREERAVSFLAAIPPDAMSFVFRRIHDGWGVAVADGEIFWTDTEYNWRGKDLQNELRQVLEARPEGYEWFHAELQGEEDWAWYADD